MSCWFRLNFKWGLTMPDDSPCMLFFFSNGV